MILDELISNFESFNKKYNYFICDIYASCERILAQMFDKNFFIKDEYDTKSIAASIYYVIDEITQLKNYNLNYFTKLFGYPPLRYDVFYEKLCEFYHTNLEVIKEIAKKIKETIRYDLYVDYFLQTRVKVAVIGMGENSKNYLNQLAQNKNTNFAQIISFNEETEKELITAADIIQQISIKNSVINDPRINLLRNNDFVVFLVDDNSTKLLLNTLIRYFEGTKAIKGIVTLSKANEINIENYFDFVIDLDGPTENIDKIIQALTVMNIYYLCRFHPGYKCNEKFFKNAGTVKAKVLNFSQICKLKDALKAETFYEDDFNLKQYSNFIFYFTSSDSYDYEEIMELKYYFQKYQDKKVDISICSYENIAGLKNEQILFATNKNKTLFNQEDFELIFDSLHNLLMENDDFRNKLINEVLRKYGAIQNDAFKKWEIRHGFFELVGHDERGVMLPNRNKSKSRFPFYIVSSDRNTCLCFENINYFIYNTSSNFRIEYINTDVGKEKVREALKLEKNATVIGAFITKYSTDIIDNNCIHIGICDSIFNILSDFFNQSNDIKNKVYIK